MKAIEINSKTDKHGHLRINYPLNKKNIKVRVIILLIEDNESEEEKLWMQSISNNPSFDFLKEPEEDIYSLDDGEPRT